MDEILTELLSEITAMRREDALSFAEKSMERIIREAFGRIKERNSDEQN